jgi:1-acyl-sn-glycerol-3-phosphate acyltransferase
VVVLAETREEDPGKREALRAAINNLAVDLIGGPADEVVLAPPHSVLKTSSGKIRRSATRDSYEHGLVGAKGPAAWLQVGSLMLRGVTARLRQGRAVVLHVAYGAWARLVFGIVAAFAIAAAFVVPGVSRRRAIARGLARALATLAAVRIEVEGLERLPARQFALVANHASYADVFVLLAAIPRDLVFVAKAEYARHWLIGPVIGRVGTRYVERFDTERAVGDAREVAAAARYGESLAFFPEGTFRRAPGLLAFRTGAFQAAATAGMPVVPVTLIGMRTLLPDETWLPRRTRVRVVVDAPLEPQGNDWESAVRLRNAARAAILARCAEPDAVAEVPPSFIAR